MAIVALVGMHGTAVGSDPLRDVDVTTFASANTVRPVVIQAPIPDRLLIADRRPVRAIDVFAALLIAMVSVGVGVRRWARVDMPSSWVAATATGARAWSRRGPPAFA